MLVLSENDVEGSKCGVDAKRRQARRAQYAFFYTIHTNTKSDSISDILESI